MQDKQGRALENTDHPIEGVVAVLVFTDGKASTCLDFGGDDRQCRREERPAIRGQQLSPRDFPEGAGGCISEITVFEKEIN